MKTYDLSELHIFSSISFETNDTMKLKNIPVENADGSIKDISGFAFANLQYYTQLFEGGYGTLTKGLWNSQLCMVKKPKGSDYLGNEALIQWYVRGVLKKYGLDSTVPEIYGIFKNTKKQVCFAMEFIHGCFPHELLLEVKEPDRYFLQILAQVCVLLHVLEQEIRLDHRDLKANNLYIRKRPISYSITIKGKKYRIEAPFQVVVLDFGFACLGTEQGISKINLSMSNFSNDDHCPKEGRDLFQLILSFWSIKTLRELFSVDLQKEIDGWLIKEKKNYSNLAKKLTGNDWVYILTADSTFSYPELAPQNLLVKILSRLS